MNCVTIKVQKSLAHYLNIVGYFFHSTCPVYRATARYALFLKFENNIEGRARLWDTALKFLSPIPRVTSPDHLEVVVEYVISAIKYLNSHDQLPIDHMAQSVRALSRSSDQLQRSWVQIPPRSQIS